MIEVRDLSVRYGQIAALRSVSLAVESGQIFAVLGANGAGKTTLIRSILGLVASSGSVRLNGRDVSALSTSQRVRCGVAVVPEGRRLFARFSVGENLRIGAIGRQHRGDVSRDIAEICDMFPILKERFDKPSRTLSGGEGQMLAIGRALMSRPNVLLLDEPSVGLMPKAVTYIFRMIADVAMRNAITVLIAEQNTRNALAIAHRVAVLELGRIALIGNPEQVARDPRVREAYLGG